MKFTLSWLKKFLDTNASVIEIANALTNIGLEVEEIIDRSAELNGFEVAKINKIIKHPSADKLNLCEVETSNGVLQIVCGAANAKPGIKVVFAKIGTLIPNGNFKIKESEIRGAKSYGMLCSAAELMVGLDSEGIIELPESAKIGEQFLKYFGLDDPVFHINVTPNRGDALGVYGIARDLAAKGIGTLKQLEIPIIKDNFVSNFNVKISNNHACPIFLLREIKDINNKQSPEWLVHLLQNIGLGSISAMVDVTNYISYSFGQPMHAYDTSKIAGDFTIELLDHNAKLIALNDKEYELKSGDLIIRDDKQIHCLAGIIGGKESSCREETSSILLEAACFDGVILAKAGRRLQIDTDSRYRFERNVDQSFTKVALDIATNMILSICGGEASKQVTQGEINIPARIIEFTGQYLTKITGLTLADKQIITILEKLGFTTLVKDKVISLTVPSWRQDISIKEDIVEEIMRIYGYDQLPQVELPKSNISQIISREQKRVFDLKRLMANSGYNEVVTWSFMDSKIAKLFADLKPELFLRNPISSDLNYMRPSVIPNLLKLIAKNQARSFKNLAFFEVGPVFSGCLPENEQQVLSAVRCGFNMPKNWHVKARLIDVFDLKADLAELLSFLGLNIEKCQINDCSLPYYHPTRSAILQLGKNIIANFGQIHPNIFDQDVFAFELNLSKLPISKPKFGKKDDFFVSDFQCITRDYAFIISSDQPVGDMLSYIKNIDKKLIRSVEIFDIYTGEKIEKGTKSVAISLQIQADDRTLNETDINTLNELIISSVEQKFKAKLREI